VQTYQEAKLDALGDPTRRAILAKLLDGPAPVGKLALDFPISRPAISQHLRILKQANLVHDQPQGNRRLYQLNPQGFDSLREYFEQFWSLALNEFKRKVEQQAALKKQ
jgi:DNA-binding transcriptional ArsR family regulator